MNIKHKYNTLLAVLASIQPKWCYHIARGEKTVEIRKNRPNIKTPFKCYIYCTKPKNKNDLGLCMDEGVVDFVFKQNYEAAKRYKMQILSGKIIGEFTCNHIDEFQVFENGSVQNWNAANLVKSCLTYDEIARYIGIGNKGYAWHISDLIIYDQPKELAEFYTEDFEEVYSAWEDLFNIGISSIGRVEYPPEPKKEDYIVKRPPQSWCYVEQNQC